MISEHLFYRTGLAHQAIEIEANNQAAYDLAHFLFQDFPGAEPGAPIKRYDLLSVGSPVMLSLWDGDKRLYFGRSQYRLAYALMNEAIFHCIKDNRAQHALHTGAVHQGDRCILLPGTSGKGKSTLTAWLVAHGYQYLTDELVFIDSSGKVSPLVRPINLKVTSSHISWPLPAEENSEVLSGREGSMIPHRLLNPHYHPAEPRVTDIVFPQFVAGASATLSELSPAKSALHLLQAHVNARNLPEHGFAEIAAMVRGCRSFTLRYGSFADLEKIFSSPIFATS